MAATDGGKSLRVDRADQALGFERSDRAAGKKETVHVLVSALQRGAVLELADFLREPHAR